MDTLQDKMDTFHLSMGLACGNFSSQSAVSFEHLLTSREAEEV